jgi:spore coat polysaccharide biosynthesis predicted glycosyltransferase SpsG
MLLLRADGGGAAGLGHVARCVAFAEEATRRGWGVAFSGEPDRFRAAFGGRVLPGAPDAATLAAQVRATRATVVLVDHYRMPVKVRDAVRAEGALLVSMESGEFGRRPADVVVDCGLVPVARPDDGSWVVLAGPRYAPLRASVRAARGRRGAGSSTKVVVTMGGGRAGAVVEQVLLSLRDTGLPLDVRALSAEQVAVPEPKPGQFFAVQPLTEVPRVAAGADLVVSAAGVTLLELCRMGVPMALVELVDNQARGYRAALDLGLAVGLGRPGRLDGDALRHVLVDAGLRDRLAATASTVVDGLGAGRVLDAVPVRSTMDGVT